MRWGLGVGTAPATPPSPYPQPPPSAPRQGTGYGAVVREVLCALTARVPRRAGRVTICATPVRAVAEGSAGPPTPSHMSVLLRAGAGDAPTLSVGADA